jgi:hypothetical protein
MTIFDDDKRPKIRKSLCSDTVKTRQTPYHTSQTIPEKSFRETPNPWLDIYKCPKINPAL